MSATVPFVLSKMTNYFFDTFMLVDRVMFVTRFAARYFLLIQVSGVLSTHLLLQCSFLFFIFNLRGLTIPDVTSKYFISRISADGFNKRLLDLENRLSDFDAFFYP